MNKFEARWNKAKTMALDLIKRQEEATKKFGKKAILVRDGEVITGQLIVTDSEVYIYEENVMIQGMFEDDPEQDNGSHTSVKDIKALFNEFEVFVPWRTT